MGPYGWPFFVLACGTVLLRLSLKASDGARPRQEPKGTGRQAVPAGLPPLHRRDPAGTACRMGGAAMAEGSRRNGAGTGAPDGLWAVDLTDGRRVRLSELRPGDCVMVEGPADHGNAALEEEPSERTSGPIRQDAGRPTTHVQGISKVSAQITDVVPGAAPLWIDMTGANDKAGPVYTSLALHYDSRDVSISSPMTPYDREVHNAVASLWASKRRAITVRQVYNAMTGAQGSPSPKAAARIEESLDKQRHAFVTIDFSAELRGQDGEVDGVRFTAEQCRRESHMLNADKTTVVTADGREVVGYSIVQEPVLYWHDRRTHQLVSYPQALLEATSTVARNTDTNLLMRSYLIQRIRTMARRGSRLTNRIRYEAVYRAAGRESPSRTEVNRMNVTIRAYLDVFVAEGEIAGWSEYRAQDSTHRTLGVEIEVADAGQDGAQANRQ